MNRSKTKKLYQIQGLNKEQSIETKISMRMKRKDPLKYYGDKASKKR